MEDLEVLSNVEVLNKSQNKSFLEQPDILSMISNKNNQFIINSFEKSIHIDQDDQIINNQFQSPWSH